MDFLRRKQKIIFWIISIIIIFSFVVVMDMRVDFGNGANADFEVGVVNGRKVNFLEFEAFRKRIIAATGGLPIQFSSAPGSGSPTEELYKFIFAMALLEDAEKAGCAASDMRVGTYLENGHPIISMNRTAGNAQSLERSVDSFCRQMQISRQDLLRGIRDWLTIDTYLNADSNLASVNTETVYTYYAFNRTEIGVKRFRVVENEAVLEQAKKEIMDQPEDELNLAVRNHIADMSMDQRYREPSGWRFSYVLVPFVSATSVRQPMDDEIQEQYDRGKTLIYEDKPLEEVKDRIKAELVQREIERQTLRNLTVDVDPQLRGQGSELALDELIKLTQLVKYSVTAGDTGEALLSPADILAKLPEGTDQSLRQALERIDGRTDTLRNAAIKEWQESFNLVDTPHKSDKGYYRLRLLEYSPSTPAEIENEDGSIKQELRELALTDLVGERAEEIVRNKAAEMEGSLRELMTAKETGLDVPDSEIGGEFDKQTIEYMSYAETVAMNYDILRMTVGDVVGPLPITAADAGEGLELLVLVERRLPSREMFDAEPVEIRNQFRDLVSRAFSGGMTFTFSAQGPIAVIQPSPTVLGSLADRFNRREIGLNNLLLESMAREG